MSSENCLSDPSEFVEAHFEYCSSDDGSTTLRPDPSNITDGLVVKDNDTTTTKSRKRSRNEANWKVNQRKEYRNTGKAYITKKGKTVSAKTYYLDDCPCPRKCHLLFSLAERRMLFDEFYKLANFDLQNAYIWSLVKVVSKSRQYTQNCSRRQNTRLYYLNTKSKDIQVCSKFFQNTLRISDGRISRVLMTKRSSGSASNPPVDKRGRSEPANKGKTKSAKSVEM